MACQKVHKKGREDAKVKVNIQASFTPTSFSQWSNAIQCSWSNLTVVGKLLLDTKWFRSKVGTS